MTVKCNCVCRTLRESTDDSDDPELIVVDDGEASELAVGDSELTSDGITQDFA